MNNTVYIQNDQERLPVTQKLRGLVRRSVNAALKYEDFQRPCEVSVTFTDNEKIKELNAQYRNIDRATDVLSFPLFDEDFEDEEELALGDVVLSLEKAEEQAKEYGHSFEREVAFLVVHSVLHLLGYDHETSEEDEKEMFFRQEEIMKLLKLERKTDKEEVGEEE
ncbi:MAG: rRNA maturation RNase YbeY [Clostridia bacterium]|nr:rRNA maturation RNase YbeY [Clostridia bacterium]